MDRLHEAGEPDDDADDRRRAIINGRGDMLLLVIGCIGWLAVLLIGIELFWLKYG